MMALASLVQGGTTVQRRSSVPSSGLIRARLLAVGSVIIALSGLQDGARSALFVAAPATPGFPLTARDSAGALDAHLEAGGLRGYLGGLASTILDPPTSTASVVDLAAVASEAGMVSWLEGFTRAVRRRIRTAETEVLAAEVALIEGRHEDAVAHLNRGLDGRPRDVNALVLRALLSARSGDLPRGFADLSRASTAWNRGGATARVSRITVSRRARLTLAVNARLARSQARSLFALRGPAIAVADARSLIAVSHLVSGRTAAAAAMLRHAQARAARRGMRSALASAVSLRLEASQGENEADSSSEWTASCRLTRNAASDVHNECLITLVGGLWRAGFVGQALVALNRLCLRTSSTARPVLEARLALAAVPLLMTLGRLEEAVEILDPAVAAAAGLRQADLEARLRIQTSMALRRLGALDRAGAEVRRALEIAPEGSSQLRDRATWEASMLKLRGIDVGSSQGDLDTEEARPTEAAALPGATISEEIASSVPFALSTDASADDAPRSLSGVTRVLTAGIEHERTGELAQASALYERARAGLQTWHSRVARGLQWSVRDAYEHLLSRQVHVLLRIGRIEDALVALETGRDLFGAVVDVDTVRKSRAHLPPNSAAVVYVAVESSVWAWIVTHRRVDVVRLAATDRELEERARLWEAAVTGGLPHGRLRDAARGVAERAVIPVLSHPSLRGVTYIATVPHASLHRVSFAAVVELGLEEAHRARRIEWLRIPSLSYLSRRGPMPRRERPFRLVVGVGRTSDTIGELGIVWQSGSVPGLRSYRPTETLIRETAPRVSLLHVAAHSAEGVSGSAEPGIALLAGPGDDGVLHFSEIVSLRFDGADVVLTGCGTAGRPRSLHRYGPVSSPSSLGEAFLLAGARSVVGSMWPLSESDGRLLAAAIYRAGGPAAGPLGLRAARRELAQRAPDRPWIWSGLVWFGAPPTEPPG